MGEKRERERHDSLYKDFFSHQAMVESLLGTFITEPFEPYARGLDFGSLTRLSGEYVGKDLTRGFSDMVWRLLWRNRTWCYVALLLEFQSAPDRLMPLRLLSYL